MKKLAKIPDQSGLDEDFVNKLDLLGFSGIDNLLSSVAKYNELTKEDIVLTILTDSMDLYHAAWLECGEFGDYTRDAIADDAAT